MKSPLSKIKVNDNYKYMCYIKYDDDTILDLERLYSNSYKDSLTFLFNRNAPMIHNKNPEDSHFYGFMDLDGFKEINDNFSHHIGNLLLTEIGKIQGVEKIICTNRNNTPLGVAFDLDDSSARVHIEGALTAVNAKQNGMYFVPLASDKKAAFKKYEIYLPINGQWEKLTGSVSSSGTTSITISDAELQAIQTETK